MSIKSRNDLQALSRIGRIVRNALDSMASAVQPGVTTVEFDQIAQRSLPFYGAEASPRKVYGFPGTACISVNEEAFHGVSGDLLKLDLTAEKDGYVDDTAVRVGWASYRRPLPLCHGAPGELFSKRRR